MKYEIDFDKEELVEIIRQHLRDKYNLETLAYTYHYDGRSEDNMPVHFNVIVDGVTYENVDVSVTIKK